MIVCLLLLVYLLSFFFAKYVMSLSDFEFKEFMFEYGGEGKDGRDKIIEFRSKRPKLFFAVVFIASPVCLVLGLIEALFRSTMFLFKKK